MAAWKPDWRIDGPARGLMAALRNFSGNRRTKAERILATVVSCAAPVLAIAAILIDGSELALWQVAVLVVLAVDLGGGVFVNASAAAKRWYHRAGARDWHHFAFVAFHLHPFLVAWFVGPATWAWAAYLYAATVAAAALTLLAAPYLRRPLALTFAVFILAAQPLVVPVPLLLCWIAPFFVVKLLVAHIVHEEPYAA